MWLKEFGDLIKIGIMYAFEQVMYVKNQVLITLVNLGELTSVRMLCRYVY